KEPITILNKLPPETLRPAFVSAVEQGIRTACMSGEVGFPVADVTVAIIAAQEHPTESSEMAFQWAAGDAVNRALRGNIQLLEPIMHLEVTVPEEYLGPVTADLNARRAKTTDVLVRGKLQVIEAKVPLVRMFDDYDDKVKSLSKGRANWTMEPSEYAPAPDEVLRGF